MVAAVSVARAQEETASPRKLPARLDEAIEVALQNRLEVAIAAQQSTSAAHRVTVARGNFLPQLSLSGTSRYIRSLDKFSGIAADARLGDQTFHVSVQKDLPSYELNAGLDLTYNIFSGGQDTAGLDESIAAQNALRQEEAATRLKVSLEVMNAYWQLRKSQILSRVAERANLYATKQFLITQTKRAAGVISELAAETEALSMRENMLAVADARREVARSLARFRESLGLDGSDPLLPAAEPVVLIDDPDRVGEAAVMPAAERPQTRRLIAETVAAEARVKAAQAAYLPRIDFFSSYKMVGRNDDYFKSARLRPDYYTVGVTLSFTLFDGFKERIALAQAEEEIARLRLRQNRRDLEAQNSDQAVAKEKSHQEVQLAELRTKLAAMKKNLAEEMYRNGKIAEIDLREAEKNHDDFVDKLLIAKIDLAVARQSIAMNNRRN